MHVNIELILSFNEETLHLLTSDIREERRASELVKSFPQLGVLRFICSNAQMVINGEAYEDACINVVSNKLLRNSNADPLFFAHLFFSHETWQPKTRIIRYNKLWRSFKSKYDLEPFVGTEETEFESQEGIRYAATTKLDHTTFPLAARILQRERGAVIYLASENDLTVRARVEKVFRPAFPSQPGNHEYNVNWLNLIETLCPEDFLLLRAYGGTEEGEISFNLIGKQTLLHQFNTDDKHLVQI